MSLMKRIRRGIWFRAMLFVRGMTLGARLIARNEAGEVLLIRHGYADGWHLPGGGVDHHETIAQAAARELEEETGYRAVGQLSLRGLSYNARQWKGDHVALFVADGIEQVHAFSPSFEIAEIGFFALDDLPDGTTPATRARLAEWQAGQPPAEYWS